MPHRPPDADRPAWVGSAAPPAVSVVVNTYNRAASLRLTLDGLSRLDYPCFEVVVVNGPSTDDTEAVLTDYQGRIKTAQCLERNLSRSRNVGIALAAAPIVAFIDDDAYPDPAWLDHLAAAYGDDEVAGAGGPVYDHTGAEFQTRYIISNRVGGSILTYETNPSAWINVPGARSFGRLIGTNSSFRRDRLIEIGGFDEEFEYFLDETDVCLRLIDAGYVIRQLDDGLVYHKFLPSDIRGETRVARDRYAVLKNTCYFALKNARAGSSFFDLCAGLADFVEAQRGDILGNIEMGFLAPCDLDKFEADVPRAFDAGWQHFLAGGPKTRSAAWFDQRQQPFVPFPIRRVSAQRLHVALISQDYPPGLLGGIGRITHILATGLAEAGHVVRVLTTGAGHNRVDLEDGVWVHRIVATSHPAPGLVEVPQALWDHAASVLDELHRIDRDRPIDVVQAPNWDAEGLAVVLDGSLRCVLGLYTPMKTVQRIDSRLAADPVAGQIAELERICYLRADSLLADSQAVVAEIETEYGVALSAGRLEVCHLGLPDRAAGVALGAVTAGVVIAFMGRLERRKGIDTLLDCLPSLLDLNPGVSVVLAGRDDIPAPGGLSYRAAFEASADGQRLADRVHFLGAVSDEQQDQIYAQCDIVVVPSRFESFGLIALEAMMFAKPIVSCDVGGIREIIEHGDSALLVAPGDADALGEALAALCRDPDLRQRLGHRGRAVYDERFTARLMVDRINRYYDRLTDRRTARVGT